MDQRPRSANGRFEKGQPSPVGARRKKGVQNKITRDIREGCIAGFARHGSNGRGEGGFAGYIYFLAKRHPKAACRVIEKLLPLTVNGTGLGNATIGTINVVAVPHDRYVSANDLAKLRPLELEHEPAIESEEAIEIESEDATGIEADDATEPEGLSVETGAQVIRAQRRR